MPLQQLANALGGFSAGVSGNLIPFQQQQAQQREKTALAQQKARESAAERQKALLVDGARMYDFAKQGNFQAVADITNARLQEAQNFPGVDFSDTQNMSVMAQRAAAGDQEAAQALTGFLERGANVAKGLGLIGEAEQPSAKEVAETERIRLQSEGLRRDLAGEGGDIVSAQVQSSQILPDGSTVQVFKDGSTRVTGPQGRVLKGLERQQAVESAQEFGVDVQSRRAAGRTGATETEKRASDLIARGIAAAESTAPIRRAIALLDQVETGGVESISLAAKQRLGIEGADEGELSNSLGKAVLSQLKETFGAAFTQEEGKRLERIEASFTKSTDTNKRLLNQALRIAERTANRAIKAAEDREGMAEAADIRDLLSFSLDIPQDQPAQAQPQVGQQGQGQIMVDANGNRARVFPDGTFEEL